jgi:hypothetical protein
VVALLQLAGRIFAKSVPSISYVESVSLASHSLQVDR